MNQQRDTVPTTGFQNLSRILLGLFMVIAGIGHLSFSRAEFQAQVPDWVPLTKDTVVILSGIVELLFGLCLIFLVKYKVFIGWLLAFFFIAVFPGNLHQYTAGIDGFTLDTDNKRFVRLFFQPVLIAWALWSTGAWRAWRRR
ncbi:MAG: hypothetical protein EOO02_23325 [Chitinophagaceae bacterium]|nr:MAG: hypothetical protein EOO02_23325 [Chitinophagaceae bacterium]